MKYVPILNIKGLYDICAALDGRTFQTVIEILKLYPTYTLSVNPAKTT